MKDNEEKIPLFVQDYLNKMDYEGYGDFVKLSRDYFKEREDYPGKYVEQAAHLNDFNRRTGQNRQLNYEDGLKGLIQSLKSRLTRRPNSTAIPAPIRLCPATSNLPSRARSFKA